MAKKLKLGIIGLSEGNGHPYSWGAIFNGYNKEFMKACPYPAIPDYLEKQNFPEDSLRDLAQVTHVWTQDKEVSKNIARASKIEYVLDEMEDMIGNVDAILLARDDAENHYEMALPFLQAGLPVFIDKPLAYTEEEANKILVAQEYEDQVFTCSSIRFAKELKLSPQEERQIGQVKYVEASVPKKWDTYAVHLIEPLIENLPGRGKLLKINPFTKNDLRLCIVDWEHVTAFIKVTGSIPCPIKITYFGEKGYIEKEFYDAYNCFKSSLEKFINVILKKEDNISRRETMEVIRIIEKGRQ